MRHRISRGIAGLLSALLAVTIMLQPAVAKAEGGEPTPAPTAATVAPEALPSPSASASPVTLTPAGAPTPTASPTATATPSSEPTATPTGSPSSSPSSSPSVAPRGGSINPLLVDDSNGIVKVKIAQAGADSTGTRTASTGTKFDYKLNISCSSTDGPCLTDGKVTIDLSAWKDMVFSFPAANSPQVPSYDWDQAHGILTLDLAYIGETVSSFTWSFSVKTPDNVDSLKFPTSTPPHADELTFNAVVSGKDFEPVTSKPVTSYTTAVLPTNTLEKKAAGDQTIGSVGNTTWVIYDKMGPTTGIILPTEYRTITDVLPAGFDFVSCTTDATSTWGACSYNAADRTVTFTSTSLTVTDSKEQVGRIVTSTPTTDTTPNSYNNTAELKMGGETKQATGTVKIINPPPPAPTEPNYSAYYATKFAGAPLAGVSTFTGNWHDDTTKSFNKPQPPVYAEWQNSESYYEIGWFDSGYDSTQKEGHLKRIGIVDDVPCLTTKSGSSGSAIYSSQKTGRCTEPAFYATSIETSEGRTWKNAPVQDYDSYYQGRTNPPITLELTDGTNVTLTWSDAVTSAQTYNEWVRWLIPEQYWGRVARVSIQPNEYSPGKWKAFTVNDNNGARVRIRGYIPDDKGIVEGDTIRNSKADVTFYQTGTWANFPATTVQTEVKPWAHWSGYGKEADIHIVDSVEGAGKSVGAQTSGTVDANATVDWSIRAYSQTGNRDLTGPFITISDLWPNNVPIPDSLLTDPTKWYGNADTGTTPVASIVPSVTLNYNSNQHLLQWKIPVEVFNTLQHANKGNKVWVGARLPSATLPTYGTYGNELEVQMSVDDNPTYVISDGTAVDDTTNWDGDAATAKAARATATVAWTAPGGAAAFELSKGVRGDLNDPNGPFMYNPARGSTTPGTGGAVFKLNFKNTGTAGLTGSVLYDVFPVLGDKGTLLYDQGRLSTKPATLTDVATPPAGVTPYYSVAAKPCRPELIPDDDQDWIDAAPAGACVDDWTATPPADLSTVTALKWVNTNPVPAGQTWSVEFTLQASADMTDPDVAWNDAAGVAKDGADYLLPVSAPKVGIHNSQTGDAVWQKVNAAGNKLGGSEWELQEVDGTDAPVGTAITITDNVGAGGYSGKDLDNKPGVFRVGGYALGLIANTKYRLVETKAPTGYEIDPTPHYVTAVRDADWSFGDLVNLAYVAPGASGSATARYNVDYDWAMDKTVDAPKKWVDPGTDASFNYTITVNVTKGDPTDLTVSGTAIFTNPSGPAISGTSTITTDSGAVCTLTNPAAATIAHGGQISVPFTCTYTSTADDTVKVTFTDPKGAVTASIPVKFRVGTETDKTLELTDTFAEFNGPRTLNAADIFADGGTTTYTYTAKRTAGGQGACLSYDNTATLAASTNQAEDTSSVSVEACGQYTTPTVGEFGGRGYYDTDYDWAIDKTVNKTSAVADANQTAPFDYTVTVTPTTTHSEVTSSGWVEFVNPNAIALDGTLTLSATTGPCTLFDADPNADPPVDPRITIAAGAGRHVYFSCIYPDSPIPASEKVTVTFTSDATASGVLTATKQVTLNFNEQTVSDKTPTLSDTQDTEFGGDKVLDGAAILASAGKKAVYTYTVDHAAPATQGDCSTYTNTASIPATTTQGALSDSTSVDVCTPAPAIDLTKTADVTDFAVGEDITYTFTAENTGNVDLTEVEITDDAAGFTGTGGAITIGDCKNDGTADTMPTTLKVGKKLICTATYTATAADVTAKSITNNAHVTGKPPVGSNVTDDASVTVANSKLDFTKQADKATAVAGQTVTYTFTATNSGATTLTDVSIADDGNFNGLGTPSLSAVSNCKIGGTPASGPFTLTPGQVLTCEATYVVDQADIDRTANLDNTAQVTATSPSGDLTKTASVSLPHSSTPGITLSKTARTSVYVAGGTIVYDLVAKNTGAVTLTGVDISEDTGFTGNGTLGGVTGCTVNSVSKTMPVSLAPGEELKCTVSYIALQSDVDDGDIYNKAKVVGTPPSGAANNVSANDDETVTASPRTTGISLTKVADKSDLVVGETIGYTMTATNTGTTTLTDAKITEKSFSAGPPLPTVTGCDSTSDHVAPFDLAPGEVLTCSASHVVTLADVNAGSVVNTATATGTPPTGLTAPSQDATATVNGTANSSIGLVKTASPASYVAGTTITYTLTATNTGNQTLTNVSIADTAFNGSPLAALSCAPAAGATLAPGETMVCTVTHVASQGDVDQGDLTNKATATGTPPSGTPITKDAEKTITPTGGTTPSIDVVKSADKTTLVKGETVTYSFAITNDGAVTLHDVNLDDVFDPGTGGPLANVGCKDAGNVAVSLPATLAPAAVLTCTGEYTVTQADVDRGSLRNTVTVTGTPPTGSPVTDTDTKTINTVAAPALTFTKTAQSPNFVAGGTVTYDLVATNTGNVTINGVTITDLAGSFTGTAGGLVIGTCPATDLAPQAELHCTATYTATQADFDRGSIYNKAQAAGTPVLGGPLTPVTDDETVTSVRTATLSLDKFSDQATLVVGEDVTYTFTATNTGNTTLTNVAISETSFSGSGTAPTIGSCQIEFPAGNVVNGSPTAPYTLAPNQVLSCKGTYTVTQTDVNAGVLTNHAKVTGKAPTTGLNPPTDPTATDVDTINGNAQPKLTVTKVARSATYGLGETITWDLVATNTGNVTLTGVTLTDVAANFTGTPGGLVLGTCPAMDLDPSESLACTATYTATQADVDRGVIKNKAHATGTPPTGPDVTADGDSKVPANQSASIEFTKTADKTVVALGDQVVYTFTAKNTGNTTLTNVNFSEPVGAFNGHGTLGAIGNCAIDAAPGASNGATLAPGQVLTCTASYTVVQDDIDQGGLRNTGHVEGTPPVKDPDGPNPPNPPKDDFTVDTPTQQHPRITVKKTADKAKFVAGDTINYTLTAENTGDVTLTNVNITDPAGTFTGSGSLSAITGCKIGAANATMPATLAPGQKLICQASYVATQADLDKGDLVNGAHVVGTPPNDPEVIGDDTVTVEPDPHSMIDLTKTADKTKLKVGETVTYTFTAKNVGNTTLSKVQITDTVFNGSGTLGAIGNCKVDGAPVSMPAVLAPGKVMTCTAAYVVVQGDVDRGTLSNEAEVVSEAPPSDPKDPMDPNHPPKDPKDKDKVDIDNGKPSPGLELVKMANRTEYEVGDTITYTLTATNTGDVTLKGVKIAESQFNGGKLPAVDSCSVAGAPVTQPVTLAPGQVLSCLATYVATKDDVVRGDLANVARVVGTPPNGPDTTGGSESNIPAFRDVQLKMEKKVAKVIDTNEDAVVDAGDQIWWNFVVTNTGKATATKLEIHDQLLAEAGIKINCPVKTLAPGKTTICVNAKPYRVTSRDVEADKVFNTATASASGKKGALIVSNHDSTITETNRTGVLPEEEHEKKGGKGKDLAFTGFAGWSIAITGGLLAVLGAAVVIVARRRRAGQES